MTDKTLFIHAGGSKTGSSALQNFFEINASRLDGLDFAYEHKLNIKNDYEINSGNGLLLYQALTSAAITNYQIDSLILSYFGQSNSAICTTEFFSCFGAHDWNKVYESSLRLGVKLKVIFYVRNVIPLFLSGYDQAIKRHGAWRSFDKWIENGLWEHGEALRTMADELPQSCIHVLHFDHERSNLIRSFLDILGIESSFKIDPNELRQQVNRSLTNEEREVLIAVNKTLGGAYSTELSNLLIYSSPLIRGEPVLCDKTTKELLIDRFSDEVDWVNNTFFNGQSVVSVLPIDPVKDNLSEKSTIQPAQNSCVEKRVLIWALEKLQTIQNETEQRLLNTLNHAAKNASGKSHPDIPADFDSLAYLLLNPDVLRAGVDPIQHFIIHGKNEGRVYKFLNRQSSI
jgi:hypothetical protein